LVVSFVDCCFWYCSFVCVDLGDVVFLFVVDGDRAFVACCSCYRAFFVGPWYCFVDRVVGSDWYGGVPCLCFYVVCWVFVCYGVIIVCVEAFPRVVFPFVVVFLLYVDVEFFFVVDYLVCLLFVVVRVL